MQALRTSQVYLTPGARGNVDSNIGREKESIFGNLLFLGTLGPPLPHKTQTIIYYIIIYFIIYIKICEYIYNMDQGCTSNYRRSKMYGYVLFLVIVLTQQIPK